MAKTGTFRVGKAPAALKGAVKRARQRQIFDKKTFDAMRQDMKTYAFTVAGDLNATAINTVLQTAMTTIKTGRSYENFRQALESSGIYDRIAAPDVVLHNATQNVYQRARYEQQVKLKSVREFWTYWTFMDERVRPTHQAMHGITAPADSDFWAANYTPNGHRCRCTVRANSRRQVEEKGIEVVKSQAEANALSFKRQLARGVPEDKLATPIADPGWGGGFQPNDAAVKSITDALAAFKAGKYKSVVTPKKPNKTAIKRAAAAKKKSPSTAGKKAKAPAGLTENELIYQEARLEAAEINAEVDLQLRNWLKSPQGKGASESNIRNKRQWFMENHMMDRYGMEATQYQNEIIDFWTQQSNAAEGTALQQIAEQYTGKKGFILARDNPELLDYINPKDYNSSYFKKWASDEKKKRALALRMHYEQLNMPETLTIYRGIGKDQADQIRAAIKKGKTVEFQMNKLSSWTTDRRVAGTFANAEQLTPADIDPGGIVIKLTVKREDVMASWRTNAVLDNYGEDEVIAIGKKIKLTERDIAGGL